MNETQIFILICAMIIFVVVFLYFNPLNIDSFTAPTSEEMSCSSLYNMYNNCISSGTDKNMCVTGFCVQNPDCAKSYGVSCQPSNNTPTPTGLTTCAPSNGQWSIPNADPLGRSMLNSPCCQSPKYEVSTQMETCDTVSAESSDPTSICVYNCCAQVQNQQDFYDPTWAPMAKCGCSLWCYNKNIPHFAKYGTAWHYVTGDIAEAQSADSPSFIGSQGDFSGLTA